MGGRSRLLLVGCGCCCRSAPPTAVALLSPCLKTTDATKLTSHKLVPRRREAELEAVQLERDWYDNEEFGGANAAAGAANPFIGDDALFAKRSTEMAQRMKRRDGRCAPPGCTGLLRLHAHAALVVLQCREPSRWPASCVCSLAQSPRASMSCVQTHARATPARTNPRRPPPCRCPRSVMSLAQSKRANELEQALNAWEDNRLLTSGVVKLRQVGPHKGRLQLAAVRCSAAAARHGAARRTTQALHA